VLREGEFSEAAGPTTAFSLSTAEGVKKMGKYTEFETRTQPWFDESKFDGFNFAIPMKTMVIYCVDPRASDVPQAVAKYFGDEVYPGELILDQAGNRVGSTRTLFTVTNGGGRAASALMTVAEMDYLFHVQNVVVVHHSFCGTSSYKPESVVKKFHDNYQADLSTLFDRDSLAIADFERSLKYDLELLRSSQSVPKRVKLYGFFYEINSGKLIEVLRDIPASVAA
jgi:carbonic anhydrase